MKIISLNLNGIRAALRKGLYAWVQAQNPDVICVQELKAQIGDWDDPLLAAGWHGHFVCAQKRGYSGVGIYSRQRPDRVCPNLGVSEIDAEGRFLRINLGDWVIVSLYLPSGSSGRQLFKEQTMAALYARLSSYYQRHGKRKFILCGDWNIAHTEKDIRNWRGNQKNSGFLPEERAWLDDVFNMGWRDAFRTLYEEDGHYTWWSNRGRAWDNNVGWRIDYQLTTPNVIAQSAEIYTGQRFSDHAPLIIEYDDA